MITYLSLSITTCGTNGVRQLEMHNKAMLLAPAGLGLALLGRKWRRYAHDLDGHHPCLSKSGHLFNIYAALY